MALGGMLILFFLLGVFVDVTTRLFGRSIDWLQEITTLVFVWCCFLGAPVLFRRGALYAIDLLPDRLPPRVGTLLRAAVLLPAGLFIWILLRYGIAFSVVGIDRVSQPSGIRIVYAFASIPASALGFLVFYAEAVVDLFRRAGAASPGPEGAA